MATYARVYFATFIDVEVVEENFKDEEEMIEWANENVYDVMNLQDLKDNMVKQPMDTEIIDL